MPSKLKPGEFLLMDTMNGCRPELALRVFEGMSQIGLTEVFSGIGEGNGIADALRTSLTGCMTD